MKRAVFLDRDGVLNETFVRAGVSYPPGSTGECVILPGVKEAVLSLAQLGLMRIVVTNQPDIARGTQTLAAVEAINRQIAAEVALDEFRICPHDDADHCACRKPKAGLILDAAAAHGIDCKASFMVGDRSGDILAGAAAGCRTFLVARPYSKAEQCRPDYVVADLAEAAAIITRLVKSGH